MVNQRLQLQHYPAYSLVGKTLAPQNGYNPARAVKLFSLSGTALFPALCQRPMSIAGLQMPSKDKSVQIRRRPAPGVI